MREKILTTSISRALGEQFKAFCAANDTNQSAMIRRLIRACLEKHDFLEVSVSREETT